MYGQIHAAMRSWVIKAHGTKKWDEIVKRAHIDEFADFLIFHRYEDVRTKQILLATCQVLGYDKNTCLREFGEAYFSYVMKSGYDQILKSLGPDMHSFLQNLDHMYSVLKNSFPEMQVPSFRCDVIDPCRLRLHYYTRKNGFYALLQGILLAVGRDLFNSSVTCRHRESKTYTLEDGQMQYYETFDIFVHSYDSLIARGASDVSLNETDTVASSSSEFLADDVETMAKKKYGSFCPFSGLMSSYDICNVLPYHIVLGQKLKIRQVGANIEKVAKKASLIGQCLSDVAHLLEPNIPFTYRNVLDHVNTTYVLAFHSDSVVTKDKMVALRGNMVPLFSKEGNIIFMSSPNLSSLEELHDKRFHMSEIPLYDATRDLILMNHNKLKENTLGKKLQQTTVQLEITTHALDVERQKTEGLVPRSVTSKKGVAAERFDSCTVLFCGLINVADITEVIQPGELIVMLDEFVSKFDQQAKYHDLFKVETVSDNYMVAGGVPTRNSRHCHNVANFSLKLLEVASDITDPSTGEGIQVRMGFNSGAVVAGVVGKQLPRYCLFGHTVHLAYYMQSHGKAGRIQFTPYAFEMIKNQEFRIKHRGRKAIRGEVLMDTYFLEGREERGKIIEVLNPKKPEEPSDTLLTSQSTLRQSSKSSRPMRKKQCAVM